MNLEVIRKNMIMISSTFTRKEAEGFIKGKKVKYLKSKGISETYHIYGKVEKINNNDLCSTHIRINKNTNKILGATCTCERFEENSRVVSNYVCSHIVATAFAFYGASKNYVNKQVREKEEEGEKVKRRINLDLNIRCIKNSGIPVFKCEFRIGDEKTHLIQDLKGFVEAIRNKSSLRINEMFFFNYKMDSFSTGDLKVLEFLVLNRELIKEKTLTVHRNKFREFLGLIDGEKKIVFNYDFINYSGKIKRENPLVAFSVKLREEEIILKHYNKFPIILDSLGEVMFFDREIYLPRKKFVREYLEVYKSFLKNREIRYEKESLDTVLGKLKDISNEVFLDANIMEYKKGLIKWEFLIYEEDGLYIEAKAIYSGYKIDLIKDKGNRSFLRDKLEEEKIFMLLERLKFIKGEEVFKFIGDENDRGLFFTKGLKKLESLGMIKNEIKNVKVLDGSGINSSFKEEDGYFKLNFRIDGFNDGDIKKAILSRKMGNKFYKKGERYLDLEDSDVVWMFNLIEDLNLDLLREGEIKIPKNKGIYLNELLKKRGASFIKEGDVLNTAIKRIIDKDYKRKLVSREFKGSLRPYQKEGFRWLNEITDLGFGGVLADDMGLGKTIQIIAFLLAKKDKKSIIVAPTSLIYNWLLEFSKFAPTLKIGLVYGEKKKRKEVISEFKKYNVLITSYGTLKNDIDEYENKSFEYLIIDEAQNIKNYKAQAARAVKSIKAKENIALTGTPIENNLLELWSIFDFVMEGYLFTKERFTEKFIDCDNIDELKKLITPFVLRREKRVVLKELPDKIETISYVELSKEEESFYKSYLKMAKKNLKDKSTSNIFGHLTKLREICLDPSLVRPEYRGKSSKIERSIEIIKNSILSNQKVILFSQFTSLLSILEKRLQKEGIEYFYLDGGTNSKKRIEMVNDFNENKEKKVFLISLKAGGVGLNLTGASVVIHFDPWWNPAVEDQATDRAYRFGQKSKVQVIKLVAKKTVEEKILELQMEKKMLIDSIIDAEKMNSKGLKSLSKEEVLELFD